MANKSSLLALSCLLAFGLSCSETDIPQLLSEPFILTRISVSNDISPPVGSVLPKGQNITVSFGAAFTLAPEHALLRQDLEIVIDFLGIDAQGDFAFLAPSPDSAVPVPAANSGIVQMTVPFDVPSGFPAVGMFVAFRDRDSGEFLTDANSNVIGTATTFWLIQ